MSNATAGQLLADARAEIARLRRVAWECARLGGADLSGVDGPEHLVFEPEEAVDAVRDLRAGHDEEATAVACALVLRVPEREVGEGEPLDKTKMICRAALDHDVELLDLFAAALPEEPTS